MVHYFNGDFAGAAEHLHKAADGREYAVLRSDRDVFVCTALDDSLRRTGDKAAAIQWAKRCNREMQLTVENGWRTLVTHYVEARLLMLDGKQDATLEQIERLVGHGFRNPRLLSMDPLFVPLHSQPRFQAVVSELTNLLQDAWQAIDQNANKPPRSN